MTRTWALGLALAGVLVTGCGTTNAAQPPLLMANGVAREAAPADAPVATTVDGLTRFGYDLYRQIAPPGANVVVSPVCVGYAFALARAGARGETAAQLDKVFGFPGERAHDALNAISRALVTTDGPPGKRPKREPGTSLPPVVTLANGLFVQRDYTVGEPFLRTLAAKYGAGVRTVDFGKGDEATRAIDEWARVQTADRIKKVFDNLDPATRVVLANAVYFRADWTHSFPDHSDKGTFTRADGSTVEATMMRQANAFRYAAAPGWQAVELPYWRSDYAMWIIVPTGTAAPDELLSPQTLDAVAGGLRPAGVDVTMPKWDFETSTDLAAPLQALGLSAPFGPGADFSGIAPGLFIGQAMHAANITVDEEGTEAAAVAAVAMPTSAPPLPEYVLRADRPFAFAIMHLPTGTPLFIGRVADPTR